MILSQSEVYVCHALSIHALTRVRLSGLNMYRGNKSTTFLYQYKVHANTACFSGAIEI